jgi:serine/threonine-protein kinase
MQQQLPQPQAAVTMQWPSLGDVVTSATTGRSYTIGNRIGAGYFSVVYECTDLWGNELAAKVLNPERGTFEQVKAAAEREFGNLLTLRNPFITHVYDGFMWQNAFYIITERCTVSLDYLINQPWYRGHLWTLAIAKSLLQAVEFIHSHGMAHKDIHLGNVMTAISKNQLNPDGPGAMQFKLGDLGLAKIAEDIDARNTQLAGWMLPPEYLDPDQFGKVGQQTDIYHCGLVLLQVHTGTPCKFTRDEILAGAPRQRAESLSAPFGPAIGKALRRHVAARLQTPLDFWRELSRPVVGGLAQLFAQALDSQDATQAAAPPPSRTEVPAAVVPVEAAQPPPKKRRRRRRFLRKPGPPPEVKPG